MEQKCYGRALCKSSLLLLLISLSACNDIRQQRWNSCIKEGYSYTTEMKIEGCTAIIESGSETPKKLAEAFWYRGRAQMAINRTKAIADYDEAIRLDPQNSYAFGYRGYAHRVQENFDLAISDYSEAIRIDPEASGFLAGRGHAYISINEPKRAIADYSEVIRLHPINPKAKLDRGFANLLLSNWPEAWSDYDAAQVGTVRFEARYGRGIAALRIGRLSEGNEDIAAALAAKPDVAQKFTNAGLRP